VRFIIPKGWKRESARHALAAKGLKTHRKYKSMSHLEAQKASAMVNRFAVASEKAKLAEELGYTTVYSPTTDDGLYVIAKPGNAAMIGKSFVETDEFEATKGFPGKKDWDEEYVDHLKKRMDVNGVKFFKVVRYAKNLTESERQRVLQIDNDYGEWEKWLTLKERPSPIRESWILATFKED